MYIMNFEDQNFKNLIEEFKNYLLAGVNKVNNWFDAICYLSDSESSDPIFSYVDSDDSIFDSSDSESRDSINDTVPVLLIDTVSDISENESE